MPTAHLALFDTLIDSEAGHLMVELHSGRFTGTSFDVVSVAESGGAVTSTGGVRMEPDALLADLDPADSDLLVLPGGEMWDAGGGEAFAASAERFLGAGVPVAATCATAGLARAGLLDNRDHTSSSPEYLELTGYGGRDRYVDARAVVDGGLITAGPHRRCSSRASRWRTWGWLRSARSTRTRPSSTMATPARSGC